MTTLICPGCGGALGEDEGQNRWNFWYGHAKECIEKNGMMPDNKFPKNPKQIKLDEDAEEKAEAAEPSLKNLPTFQERMAMKKKAKPAKRAKRAIRAKKAEQAKRAPQAKRAKRAKQAKLVTAETRGIKPAPRPTTPEEKARRIVKDMIAKARMEIEG